MSNPQLSNTEWVKSSSYSLVNERDIAIFQMGKERGAVEEKEKIDHIISENFSKSYEHTSRVIKKLSDISVPVISARLKIKAINCLRIALAINSTDLSSEKIEEIYNFIYELEQSENSSDYSVDFSIIKANDSFNDETVENDGYIYKHRLLLDEESTRTA